MAKRQDYLHAFEDPWEYGLGSYEAGADPQSLSARSFVEFGKKLGLDAPARRIEEHKLRQKLKEHGERPVKPPPSEQAPKWTTEDLIKGLAPLLVLSLMGRGKDAARYGSGYLQGKMNQTQRTNARDRELYLHELSEDERRGAELRRQYADVRMRNLDPTGLTIEGPDDSPKGFEQTPVDRPLSFLAKGMREIIQSQGAQADRHFPNIARLSSDYLTTLASSDPGFLVIVGTDEELNVLTEAIAESNRVTFLSKDAAQVVKAQSRAKSLLNSFIARLVAAKKMILEKQASAERGTPYFLHLHKALDAVEAQLMYANFKIGKLKHAKKG